MSRLLPYLGIAAALAIGMLIAVFINSSRTVPHISTTIIPVASSTPFVENPVATTSAAETVPVIQKVVIPQKKTKPAALAPSTSVPASSAVTTTIPTPIQSVVENSSLDSSASSLRGALVNIICTAPAGSALHSISGSGVFIDSKGIILTNAHVAQNFLLADRGVSCVIRSGSPAVDSYNAALIYISPAWLHANSGVLTETAPNGTGEYDFALLAATGSVGRPNTSIFPSIPIATTPPAAGTPVVIASYGAQFLQSSQVQFALSPTVVFGSVKDVFTFETNTIDVLALGGSAAAQEGSSGGGVADSSGSLVGTITTSTITGSTDTRSLNAITASYIRAEYASETGEAIDALLSKPTATSVSNFAQKIPTLESIITAGLR